MPSADATFGDLLRRSRLAAGLTQAALAERAGLSVGAVAALERGRRAHPRLATVALLADALGLAPAARAALTAAAASTEAPPAEAPSAPPLPSSLPAPSQPLIGRADQLAALAMLLTAAPPGGAGRLITLTGSGGVGKTRLALAAADAARPAFRDGVIFVDLSTVRDTGLVLPTIARTLRVREAGATPEQAPAQVTAALLGKHALLVLDNFEQVAGAAPHVGRLVAECPELVVLVTSRAPLRLRGERQQEVTPLPIPAAGPTTVAELAAVAAVQLFLARAGEARPDFVLDEASAVAVADICRRLDGLPLAIELAAARIRLLPPRSLAVRLERRLPLLTSGARDLPARQQTLRAAIAWSYDLLTAEEQRLFRQLSAFAGGCTLADMAAVCAASGERREPEAPTPEDALLDTVAPLIDHGLLIAGRPADDAPAEPCFRMLETIREFAEEQLAQRADEAAAVRARHAQRFLTLAEQAEPALAGPQQTTWLRRLEREHDNFRAALGWSVQSAPLLGLRLAGLLGAYWDVRGHYTEGRRWFASLLAYQQLSAADDQRAALPARARALLEVGILAANQGDVAAASAHFDEALALFRALGDRRAVGVVLQRQGTLAQRRGAYGPARAAFEESLAVFVAIGNRLETGNALRRLGELAAEEGDYAHAAARYAEAQALFEALGDRYAAGWLLNQQARLAQTLGDYEQAQLLLERSLALNKELGNRRAVAWDLAALGNVARIRGNAASARQHLAESVRLFDDLGDRMGRAGAAQHLGHLAAAEGAFAEAERQYAACLEVYRERDAAVLSGIALGDLARLARQAGARERASALWREALTLVRRFPENRWFTGWSLAGMAVLLADQGRDAAAVALMGAGAASHAGFWASFDPDERAQGERILAAARAALGDESYETAWRRGQTLSFEQALDEAAALLDPAAAVRFS